MFPFGRSWVSQPPEGAGIAWSDPITQGLLFLAPLSGEPPVDLVAQELLTRTGNLVPSTGPNGVHSNFGSSNYLDLPFVPPVGTGPATFAWTEFAISPTGYSTVLNINFGTPGSTNSFAIYRAATDATYAFVAGPRGAGGSSANSPSFGTPAGLIPNRVLNRYLLRAKAGVFSYTPSDYDLWKNGVRLTTSSTAAFGAHTSAIARIGARDTGADPWRGLLGNLHIWGRSLLDEEAQRWTLPDGEWCTRAPRRILFPVSVAGGAYTLTAEQGSYALTGQAANTLYSRSMPADQGSYALTGQAAGLAKGVLLTADQGSYALSGQAANFALAYLLAAAQGSYALTGQSANTLYSRLLSAAQGSYALTGQDATLTYAPAGAYSMPADQGSYALTGQDAALKLSAVLAAAQGSYALTGQAATLTFGKVMAAAQGSYTLSGQAAAFSRTYALSAAFGSYTLSGQVATLTYAGLIAVFLETVRLRSRITQAVFAPSRITQQLSLRSQVRH